MTGLWIAIAVVAGLAVGGIVGYLIAGSRAAVARQRAQDADERHAAADAERRDLATQLAQVREARDRAETRLESAREDLALAEQAEATLATTRDRLSRVEAKLEATTIDLDAERERFAQSQLALKDAFANLSREALTQNREEFLSIAKQRFEQLAAEAKGDLGERQKAIDAQVGPLKESLEHYRKQLAEIEEARQKAYVDVSKQLGEVGETQRLLGTQTSALVTALRRPGTRGQWGELTLRRLLELAGMTANYDFREQAHLPGEEDAGGGGDLRPDLVVDLPGGRTIVVDSKYAADDFLKAAETDDQQQRQQHLQAFARAVRGHATKLGQKDYTRRFKNAPEYVVMFLPGEALIYAAAEADPSILEDAFAKNVIIATPTTLVALLKTVAAGWREAAVEANIEEVKKLGGELVDRIAVFADHLQDVGRKLDSAVQSYNSSISSLESRLLVTGRKMKELGTDAKNEVPEVKRIDAATRNVPEIAWDVD